MTTHTVLWDGRRNGPNGAQLFIPEEAAPQPTQLLSPVLPRPGRSLQSRVYAVLTEPLTLTEIRARIPRSLADNYAVQSALFGLRKAGKVEACGQVQKPGRCFGKRLVMLYRRVG
jgi:hypothetical protein